MHKYKVTVIGIGMVDWQTLKSALFGDAQTVWEQFGGQNGEFHFEQEPTLTDLGALIKVEVVG
jgi:hypothetical protein